MKTISEIKWGKNMDDPEVDALDVRVFIDTALIKLHKDPKAFIRDEVNISLNGFLEYDLRIQQLQKLAEEREKA